MPDNFCKLDQPITKPYHYTECGLSDVYILNGYKPVSTPYGDGIAVEDEDDLFHAIGLHLVLRRPLLNGEELRFLRNRLEMTQAQLAKLLRHDAQTVARWEKGQSKISGAADGLIRMIYLVLTDEDIPDDFLSTLTDLDILESEPLTFEETDDGWKVAAAAA